METPKICHCSFFFQFSHFSSSIYRHSDPVHIHAGCVMQQYIQFDRLRADFRERLHFLFRCIDSCESNINTLDDYYYGSSKFTSCSFLSFTLASSYCCCRRCLPSSLFFSSSVHLEMHFMFLLYTRKLFTVVCYDQAATTTTKNVSQFQRFPLFANEIM